MSRRARVISLVGVFSLAIVLTIAFLATGTVTVSGYTPGSFAVNQLSGSAQYQIPIKTPVGVKGMEPHLGLVYSSSSGNGLLGMGWALSGVSAITRRPTIALRDGVTDPVDYDANDRFSLNGNTLICISGTYGQNGAEYRTERDEFARIVSYGTAGAGPAWFKVWTKDGTIMEFGNTADSRVEAVGRSDAAVWAVNRIEDRCGNFMSFLYTEDPSTGEYRISTINYAYTSGQPRCSVEFQYQDRSDEILTFSTTSPVRVTKLLSSIQTYVGDQMVLNYQLAYENGGAADKSRLMSVSECSGTGECLPPTVFTWKNNSLDLTSESWASFNLPSGYSKPFQPRSGDFNGDGKADLIVRVQRSTGSQGVWTELYLSTGTGFQQEVWWKDGNDLALRKDMLRVGDFNGDGLTDMYIAGSSYVYISTGQGFLKQNWNAGGINTLNHVNGYLRVGDFNGDGLTDLVAPGGTNNTTSIYLSNGSSFDKLTWSTPGLWYWAVQDQDCQIYGLGLKELNYTLGDFNGDGMTDLMVVKDAPACLPFHRHRVRAPRELGFVHWV